MMNAKGKWAGCGCSGAGEDIVLPSTQNLEQHLCIMFDKSLLS